MSFESWVLLIGGLLLLMGLFTVFIDRLPFTGTMVYLAIGAVLGPAIFNVVQVDPHDQSRLFLRVTEITVVISLFSVGLKLRLPWRDPRWRPALMLAFVSMTATIGLVTLTGVWALQLPLGAAVLLGAILAPTDPVLASDLQLKNPADRTELRLALTGEAGFNDGTAFPFVMLGLGLLGLHDLGAGGWRWWAVDVVWAICGGLALGAALGYATGRVILALRKHKREGPALDAYLLLGLIGLAYAGAIKLHTYGFLAVFAAGVAVRAVERRQGKLAPHQVAKVELQGGPAASGPALDPAHMAGGLLSFNEQLERILEVGAVLLVGVAISTIGFSRDALWFAPLLFVVLRPLAVLPVMLTGRIARKQLTGIAWFGIRGIGSIYYLIYAIEHGLPETWARPIATLTFTVVAASIVVHGISATPLQRYLLKHRRG